MMTAREQKRFDRLATAVRRICAYQTPKQLERSSGRAYGLEYCEALEYAYENMRNEAMAVAHLVRPKRRRESPQSVAAVDPVSRDSSD